MLYIGKGCAIIHQHLQPTYVKLHDELGGPSSEACHEHCNTLIDNLSTEKASDMAHITMPGGDVAHQMALSQSKIDSEVCAILDIYSFHATWANMLMSRDRRFIRSGFISCT
jgi:hypothetical protein